MRTRRIVVTAALAAVAALLVGPSLTGALVATASAASCPDVDVVFARGTGEPPGLGGVGDAFVESLRSKAEGRSVDAYAVNYPASYNFLGATDGANDASGHIHYMVDNCPDARLVLGGYSQGAAVIDIITAAPIGGFGFSQPLSSAIADHVAAVALFGNPSKHLGPVMTSLAPQYAPKTIDLCDGRDPVCADSGRNFGVHAQYGQSSMPNRAAAFVAERL